MVIREKVIWTADYEKVAQETATSFVLDGIRAGSMRFTAG